MDINEAVTTGEVAQRYQVSERTVQRWIEHGLQAEKATQDQILTLLANQRIKGLPPHGIWLIRQADLVRLESIRKPVGYPKGRKRT